MVLAKNIGYFVIHNNYLSVFNAVSTRRITWIYAGKVG